MIASSSAWAIQWWEAVLVGFLPLAAVLVGRFVAALRSPRARANRRRRRSERLYVRRNRAW